MPLASGEDLLDVDFADAPPLQGGTRWSDLLPRGLYLFRSVDVDKASDDCGRLRLWLTFEVAEGAQTGAAIQELFVFPASGEADRRKKVGLQRFHALLRAIGLPDLTDQRRRIKLSALIGKYIIGDTKPRHVEADEEKGYVGRDVSQIVAFKRPLPALRVPPEGVLVADVTPTSGNSTRAAAQGERLAAGTGRSNGRRATAY